jgi:hypothetical protein
MHQLDVHPDEDLLLERQPTDVAVIHSTVVFMFLHVCLHLGSRPNDFAANFTHYFTLIAVRSVVDNVLLLVPLVRHFVVGPQVGTNQAYVEELFAAHFAFNVWRFMRYNVLLQRTLRHKQCIANAALEGFSGFAIRFTDSMSP